MGVGGGQYTLSRDVPTLAALLALHTYCQDQPTRNAIDGGLAFLRLQAAQWAELPLDALPIAAEMILPHLVEEAITAGLALNRTDYASLYRLRAQKYERISQRVLRAGTAPTYSWEALGQDARALLPDYSGGIGHSPAATAAWLRQAATYPELAETCAKARRYLAKAATATGLDLPGVVPNVWPITGFELAYAPYALLITDLLNQPALQDVVRPVLDELWLIMQRGHGVSFGEYFTPDVDDTGLAMAVLQATARQVDPAVVMQFKSGDHFCTFRHELNPSIFANAHALYGLTYAGKRDPTAENFLCSRQFADGRWEADKLHTSWLYTTLEVVAALTCLGYTTAVEKAVKALLRHQKPDGGWSSGQRATRMETSYGLITLTLLHRSGVLNQEGENARQRGYQWLRRTYCPHTRATEQLWLGKEQYAPYRVDRVYELSALLSVVSEGVLNVNDV